MKTEEICPQCGETIDIEATKCEYCGKTVNQDAMKKTVCPICAEPIEEGTSTCPHCNERADFEKAALEKESIATQAEEISEEEYTEKKRKSRLMTALVILAFVVFGFFLLTLKYGGDEEKTDSIENVNSESPYGIADDDNMHEGIDMPEDAVEYPDIPLRCAGTIGEQSCTISMQFKQADDPTTEIFDVIGKLNFSDGSTDNIMALSGRFHCDGNKLIMSMYDSEGNDIGVFDLSLLESGNNYQGTFITSEGQQFNVELESNE